MRAVRVDDAGDVGARAIESRVDDQRGVDAARPREHAKVHVRLVQIGRTHLLESLAIAMAPEAIIARQPSSTLPSFATISMNDMAQSPLTAM